MASSLVNDVIMLIAGLWRYGDWRHGSTGCNAVLISPHAEAGTPPTVLISPEPSRNQSDVSYVPYPYEIVSEFSVVYSSADFDQVLTLNS